MSFVGCSLPIIRANPAAASPRVCVTHRRSPGFAPERFKALPVGTLPMTVTVTARGPRVRSPPTSGKDKDCTHRSKPWLKLCNQSSSGSGKVSASVMAKGSAAIAAKSLAAAATARVATYSGKVKSGKCVPSTTLSEETTSSELGGSATTAPSSPTPKRTCGPAPKIPRWR